MKKKKWLLNVQWVKVIAIQLANHHQHQQTNNNFAITQFFFNEKKIFSIIDVTIAIYRSVSEKSWNKIFLFCFLQHIPSRDIPTAIHFFKRQYWQRLRLIRNMEHCWFFVHGRYWIFCWMERRKNPCELEKKKKR